MQNPILSFLFAAAMMLSGCGAAKVTLGEPFQLKLGETARLKGDNSVKVTFSEKISDSRCPKNTTCVWAGEAKVLLDLSGKATEFTLPGLSDDSATKTEGAYTYQLNKLEPYPEMSDEKEEEEKPEPTIEMVIKQL